MRKYLEFSGKYLSFHHFFAESPNPDDFKMHTHESCELCYFISGKGTFYIEGSSYSPQSGDILIMNSNESHYIEIDPRYPYERFAIHFKKELIEAINAERSLLAPFENRAFGKINLYNEEDFGNNTYLNYLNNMIKPSLNSELQVITNLFPLLNEISNAFGIFANNSFDDDSAVIRRIIRYISDNLTSIVSLKELCDEFFISKSQLCRIFKKSTGSTVWNYITVKRLMQAKSLIDSGSSPTAIYSKCGFSDYSVFFKAYKKHFGYSPGYVNNLE